MSIRLPDRCPRGLEDCEPISQVCSDDGESFICCGFNDGSSRVHEPDIFRHCWKNSDIDELSDFDERDIADTASVLTQALSVLNNRRENSAYERLVDSGVTEHVTDEGV